MSTPPDGTIFMLRAAAAGAPPFQVETVSSPLAIQRGLSGRSSMPKMQGMFFIFSKVSVHSMWMPEMYFPLDIVWLDDSLRVIHVVKSATPCPSRDQCPSYSSEKPASYAIELNASMADRLGLHVGAQLSVV